VKTKKPVCSYRSPFRTQTMDSGLHIVPSNCMAASWWASWVQPLRGGYCQDHVQLQTLIQFLWLHRSSTAQLTSVHHSYPGRAHTLLLSATPCISLYPVITSPLHQPCSTMSSPCPIYIFYLVVFSSDLTYFHWT